jgi:hypothetical protein
MIQKPFTYIVKEISSNIGEQWEGTVKELPDVAVYESTAEKTMQTVQEVAEDVYNHYNETHTPKTKKWIWVTFQKAGLHRYPAAGIDSNLESVDYLQHTHRHKFHFKVKMEVFHNDRDLEFIMVQEYCESLYGNKTLIVDYRSVEMIAEDLYNILKEKYPNRDMIIDVSEDGENGCSIEFFN